MQKQEGVCHCCLMMPVGIRPRPCRPSGQRPLSARTASEGFLGQVLSTNPRVPHHYSVMARVALNLCLAFAVLGWARSSADVRLVDAAGSLSSVGLLQVNTDAGFGSVCGANAAAADAARPLAHVFV